MSFILDALKKSETERQRRDTPGIANIPEHGRRKSSFGWLWIIGALLAINLVVLAGLIYRPGPAPAAIEAPASIAGEEAGGTSFSEMAMEANRSQPTVVTVEPRPATLEATTSPVPDVTSDGPPTGSVDEGLQSFNELRARGILQLPDMHLDIHVYSSEPEDRFVFVNMSKYKENATLDEGPLVREITQDGVVLQYQGTAFLLPRE